MLVFDLTSIELKINWVVKSIYRLTISKTKYVLQWFWSATLLSFFYLQEYDGYYDKCLETIFHFLLAVQR